MITLYDKPVVLKNGVPVPVPVPNSHGPLGNKPLNSEPLGGGSGAGSQIRSGDITGSPAKTITSKILHAHSSGADSGRLKIKFDALVSHDITYVGIIQTARASGMSSFPVPYALTNCHNSLCAVGGTINEDDHVFGLSAAKKYGGIFVPANQAVIHQYAREALCASGGMILGSDSHTRYGALGVMGIGEGGPELVKQLLGNTYDINYPEVVLVWLENAPPRGVGPHDIAIAMCGAVYGNGFAKNKVLEFAGPGLSALPIDYRFGIDVMTTETACLSSIWQADDSTVADYYAQHGREGAYAPLAPEDGAAYGSMIKMDLSKAEPMAAAPFHPSKAFTISEMNANAADILLGVELDAEEQFGKKINLKLTNKIKNGRIQTDQGVIAGCAGGMYDNIREAAAILDGRSVGDGYFSLSVYPSSMPVNLRLVEDGIQSALMQAGALFKPCFCGPCFGAGDVPANNGLSIRHTTRNFINREGARPGDGQLAAVALMDARSIAATAANGGLLTSAAEIGDYGSGEFGRGDSDGEFENVSGNGNKLNIYSKSTQVFNSNIYKKRVYNGFGNPKTDDALIFGPNIADWPAIDPLGENLLLCLASVIHDEVTTTDELIPSGETSSYRSNPIKLADFTLSRRDPQYVSRAKKIRGIAAENKCIQTTQEATNALHAVATYISKNIDANGFSLDSLQIASAIYANKPGDGSAREQAASCQRVLGGGANICREYATKRYRSNLINWGMLPLELGDGGNAEFFVGDWIYIPGVRNMIKSGIAERIEFNAWLVRNPDESKTGGIEDYANTDINKTTIGSYKAIPIKLYIGALSDEECEIILQGCLMNYYAAKNA